MQHTELHAHDNSRNKGKGFVAQTGIWSFMRKLNYSSLDISQYRINISICQFKINDNNTFKAILDWYKSDNGIYTMKKLDLCEHGGHNGPTQYYRTDVSFEKASLPRILYWIQKWSILYSSSLHERWNVCCLTWLASLDAETRIKTVIPALENNGSRPLFSLPMGCATVPIYTASCLQVVTGFLL